MTTAIERVSSQSIGTAIDHGLSTPLLARPLFSIGSTIQAAQRAEDYRSPWFKPILSPPSGHYMIPILQIQQRMEQLARLEGAQFDTEIRDNLDRLQSLNQKRLETLQLHAREIENKQTWGVWQAVSQYVASTSSIVMGAGCASMGGPAAVVGAFLIASGGLGIFNRVMSDTGCWTWICSFFTASKQLQLKHARLIDTYTTYISVSLALAGAIGAYHAGVTALLLHAGRDVAFAKASGILTTAGTTMQMIAHTAQTFAKRKMLRMQADLKEMEQQVRVKEQRIIVDTAQTRNLIEITQAISQVVKQAIDASST